MKKTLKLVLLVAFMSIILFALTGCGDKLVATRETDQYGMTAKETIEVSFKGDTVNNVKWTYEFEDKETAEGIEAMFKMMYDEEEGMKVKQSGKKLIIELDAEAYEDMSGEDATISKDELKEEFEDLGYDVK